MSNTNLERYSRLTAAVVEGARTLARLIAARQEAEQYCHRYAVPQTPTLEEAIRNHVNALSRQPQPSSPTIDAPPPLP